MIEVKLDEAIFTQAEHRLKTLPIYKKSHRKNGANQTGVIGEIVAERWLTSQGVFYTEDKTTQYDLRLLNGETIDVKTKERRVMPRQSFDCSVAMYNKDFQRPDYYLFVSLRRDPKADSRDLRRFTHAYIIGAVNQAQLEAKGRLIPKDTEDSDNHMVNWTDMMNIFVENVTECPLVASKWKEVSPSVAALSQFQHIPLPKSRPSTTTGNVANAIT